MKALRRGSQGYEVEVERWQHFLIGHGFKLKADGDFGPATEAATKRYQKFCGEIADGIVGNETLRCALDDGFDALPFEKGEPPHKVSAAWPPKPTNLTYLTDVQREKLLGKFGYKSTPTTREPEKITVDKEWVKENIVRIQVPKLAHVTRFNGKPVTSIRMHRIVVPHFEALLEDWENLGLLDRILTWDGDYYPRYIRGSSTKLSNHSFGSAFDINRAYNALGHVPALVGERGSVRELVPAANKRGFYWGGHYNHRKDGMHFEFSGKKS